MLVDDSRKMKSLISELKLLSKSEVRVGVLSNEGAQPKAGDTSGNTGLTVAEVFSYHELGRGNNPKRSSLGWVVSPDGKLNEVEDTLRKWAGLVIDGKAPAGVALGAVGEYVIAETKRRIKSGIAPELSESRKKQKIRAGKSGNTPLIHTGQLINSFRYEIKERIT